MPQWFHLIVTLPLGVLGVGCATCHQASAPPPPPPLARGVVFAVDGAGGFEATSRALRQAIVEEGLPLRVETVAWSHGFARFLADQIDRKYSCQQGQILAAQILALRQTCPQTEVYILGHSAGCAVALAAAETLPQDSIQRIILLAPSVCSDYDLKPALRAARDGIDAFCSRRDIGYLGIGVAITGTADRRWFCGAAGRVGFRPPAAGAPDDLWYNRLRQHHWDSCVEWTGNHGGHYDTYKTGFLHAYVLPLLRTSPEVALNFRACSEATRP